MEADPDARAALIARYLPYAKAVAARLFARRPHEDVAFEDYLQLATVGLLESVDRYRPDRGTRFTTFATPRIRGAVLSGLERLTERRQQSAFRRRVLAERVATLVPEGEGAGFTKALLDQLEAIGVGVALGLLLDGTGMVLGAEESLPDNAYPQVELRRARQRLWEMVEQLGEKEREVMQRHYGEGMRFDEVARRLQLSKGRVSQLHTQAIQRLRGLMGGEDGCDVHY